ncbi:MAG: hypothetical protein LUG96_14725 [Tannerellaceae bacterium]|nr:hypothetical protein [Tannerellaceae bacterium]
MPQQPKDPDSEGQINIYHTNNWKGERRTGSHWLGDLPAEIAHIYLEQIIDLLKNKGWEFTPSQTKILMLTNNILAEEQYYSSIASIFQDSDDYLKKIILISSFL